MHPFESNVFESNVSDNENSMPGPINAAHGKEGILRFLADSSRYLELVPNHWEEIYQHPLLKQYCNKENS